jgi:hypothetical protein
MLGDLDEDGLPYLEGEDDEVSILHGVIAEVVVGAGSSIAGHLAEAEHAER